MELMTGADAGAAGSVQSVDRAMRLLEAVGQRGGVAGISDLGDDLGLPRATVHRLACTLVARGYLRRSGERRYALGPGLIRLGDRATNLLGEWALPELTHLVDELGETANLAMLDGSMVVYLAQVPSRYSMRTFTEVGRRVHPHSSGVGKALLARLEPRRVEQILRESGMPRYTDTTITDEADFARELDAIRARGYAIDEGEYESGSRCFAMAVPSSSVTVALSVSGPTHRVRLEESQRWVGALRASAAHLVGILDSAPGISPS